MQNIWNKASHFCCTDESFIQKAFVLGKTMGSLQNLKKACEKCVCPISGVKWEQKSRTVGNSIVKMDFFHYKIFLH